MVTNISAGPSLLGQQRVPTQDLTTDSSRITLTTPPPPTPHTQTNTCTYLPQPPSTHYPTTLIPNPSEVNQKVPGHKVMTLGRAWYPTLPTG